MAFDQKNSYIIKIIIRKYCKKANNVLWDGIQQWEVELAAAQHTSSNNHAS
jgi:hypothetical protein